MPSTVTRLPDPRLEGLGRAYGRARADKRRQLALGLALFALAFVVSAWIAEVKPATFAANLWRFTDYIGRIFTLDSGPNAGRPVFMDPAEWLWGLDKWLRLMGETLLIAYVGTVLGGIGAFLACFFSARNLTPRRWTGILAKRLLEICRTVPEIVFALIFVVAFGLGPVPGVLAIAIHTFGALGKQFAEVAENVDMKPVEGLAATGATWPLVMRFAVVPQVAAGFTSYALLRFEVNVRGAAVMGFVGAGGIGQDLVEAIRKFYYADVSAILVIIILTVMVIDLGTERLRHRFLAEEGRA